MKPATESKGAKGADDSKVDVQQMIDFCREVLGDDKSSDKLRQKARDVLIALGVDVEDAEKGAKALARMGGLGRIAQSSRCL